MEAAKNGGKDGDEDESAGIGPKGSQDHTQDSTSEWEVQPVWRATDDTQHDGLHRARHRERKPSFVGRSERRHGRPRSLKQWAKGRPGGTPSEGEVHDGKEVGN